MDCAYITRRQRLLPPKPLRYYHFATASRVEIRYEPQHRSYNVKFQMYRVIPVSVIVVWVLL